MTPRAEPTDEQLLRDHYDESKQTAVVALPVATWRLVAACVRYCADGIVPVAPRAQVATLVSALPAIHTALALRIPDAKGQTAFWDEVADSPDMTPEQKIHWLRICVTAAQAEVARLRPEPAATPAAEPRGFCEFCGVTGPADCAMCGASQPVPTDQELDYGVLP